MKSDSTRLDAIARGHLKDPRDSSHRMHRYEAPAEFAGLVRWFWIPVWSVPPGQEAPQKVLQYPNSLIVVAQDYARFYGVTAGLSTTTLSGDGWAVGVACAPAAGYLLTGSSMADHTDRFVDVDDVLGDAGRVLTERVRTAMSGDPLSPDAHAEATAAFADALRPVLPVDTEGELVNRLVEFVESRGDVTRVAQLCEGFGLSERALQRLVHRRIGLTPKWLIQRRRLQEAAQRLRTSDTSLADVAAALGYADQPHFSRDFSSVTGMTPREFATLHAR